MRRILILAMLALPPAGITQTATDQQPFDCTYCDEWNKSQTPYQLAGNSWYVGPAGLSSVLIVDSGEMALIDGALPQSADQILSNIETLGFDPQHLKWILNSHPHFDHAGGIAALSRITGARVAAGEKAVVALEKGPHHPEDPQAGFGEAARFPSVPGVHPVKDGDKIAVGEIQITAVASPGHAPGGMAWTWQSCSEDSVCQDIVFLDSLNAVSADGYRFSDHPDTIALLETSIERIANLPCDVAVAAHPDGTPRPRADATVCAVYAEIARQRLAHRLENETRQDN